MGRKRGKDANDAARESLCRRCGVCCHEKVRFGDRVVITDIPCPFLDAATNLCAVYPDRFARQPRCASAEASVRMNALPGDCPYVDGADGFIAPHLLSEHPEYAAAVDALFPDRRMSPPRGGSGKHA